MIEISGQPEDERLTRLGERLELAVARVCPEWIDAQAIVDLVLVQLIEIEGQSLATRETPYLYRAAHGLLIARIRAVRAAAIARGSAPDPGAGDRDLGRRLGKLERAGARAVTLYLLGHTVPEIATLLGLETKDTERLVHRGLAELRASLTTHRSAP